MRHVLLAGTVFSLISSPPMPAQVPAATALDTLVETVVAAHPELRFYEAELAAARADGRAAVARADPEVSVSLGRKSARAENGLSREGMAWSLTLAQTFEWPGRMALRKAIAERDLALADLALEGFRTDLGGRVRSLAFGLMAARERASAVAEVAERFRELRETFLAREPGGLAPQLETRVIEAQELVLQQRATEAQLEVDTALIELNILRGAAPDAALDLPGTRMQFAAPPDAAHVRDLALERHVLFRTRLLELERQGLRVTLARHEGRPAVTVAPFIEEEEAGERERTVGVGVSVPLPVSGRTRALAVAEESRRAQAEAALRAAQLELERELQVALHAHRTHRAHLDHWPASTLASFRDAAAAADRHYRLGAVPLGTYIELQTAYLEAVESLLEIERATLEAGLKLESLTSGAWRAVEVQP